MNGTDPGSRLGNEEEREKATEHGAGEKDCTKLSIGCLDELMLVATNNGASWSSMVCTISLA